jgi:hypothetical protein
MGNTHTKLLAGAFSVLSVMQLFMVSNLANQVNQFTENSTASIVAAVPRSAHYMRMQGQNTMDPRLVSRFKNAQKLRSAAGEEVNSTNKIPTGMQVITLPNGRKAPVLLNRPGQTSTQGALPAAPTMESVAQ